MTDELDRSRLWEEADSKLHKINWFKERWLSLDRKDRHFIIDQILTLIPDIEEAKKQERERIGQILTDIGYYECCEDFIAEMQGHEKDMGQALKEKGG